MDAVQFNKGCWCCRGCQAHPLADEQLVTGSFSQDRIGILPLQGLYAPGGQARRYSNRD